jgi:hypothetical protein
MHVPATLPTASAHRPPLQQSPSYVHGPPIGSHATLAHRRMPLASATHGAPPQQPLDVAHVSPAA